jgi:hypothetical protein
MTHPDLKSKDPVITTDAAFEKVWTDKGWQKIADPSNKDKPAEVDPSAKKNPVVI